MRHVLVVNGKLKGHGKNRKPVPEYIGPCPDKAAREIRGWYVQTWLGLPSYEDAIRNQATKAMEIK